MKHFLTLFAMMPVVCAAQDSSKALSPEHGIQFIRNLSWEQILVKAKLENKYVFVDCFATWCGPCKWMDKNVYSDDSVGEIIDEEFLSVKIQMDTTKKDDDQVRDWYSTAHELAQRYEISAYPSFLVFAPDGHAVHKRIGTLKKADFLVMMNAAADPNQQYYTLLNRYRSGGKDYSSMPALVRAAVGAGKYKLAAEVREDYVHNYLDQIAGSWTWSESNVRLAMRFSSAMNCSDKIFESYYQNREQIDSVTNDPHFADTMINDVIYRTNVKPCIDSMVRMNQKPKWSKLRRQLRRSFVAFYVNKDVLDGEVEYYKTVKDWKRYVEVFIAQQKMAGIETWKPIGMNTLYLNNDAYEVFQYGNRRQLKMALTWVDRVLSPDSKNFIWLDTKASLLYKLGREREAMELEEKAYHNVSEHSRYYADIKANYDRMKSGLPTWVR